MQIREDVAIDEIEPIAEIAHEVNRAYCASLGDLSQPSWKDAPAWQRDSAMNGVRAHLVADLTPEQSHQLWLDQKLAEGWAWGPTKDPGRKLHPCCLPYDRLPVEQRTKDYLFRAVVRTVRRIALAAVDDQVAGG